MKINVLSAANASGTMQSPIQGSRDFDGVMSFAGQRLQGDTTAIAGPKTPQQELAEYLRKSPGERMRDAILKKHGLTEADLAAMPPEKRIAMEETIIREIKEALLKTGANAQYSGQALLAMVAFASDALKDALAKESSFSITT